MDKPGRPGRRSRWVASGGAVVIVGAVLTGTVIAAAAAPSLPKRTPAQLLVDMRHATVPSAMTAVIQQSANLGFPALPDIPGLSSSTLSAASLIAGTHTVDIWYAGPRHVRIALPVSFGETDLRVNGHQIWLWDSKTQTATRVIVPSVTALRPVAGQVRFPLGGMPPTACSLRGIPVARAVLRARVHGAPAPLRRVMLRMLRVHGPNRVAIVCVNGLKGLVGKPGRAITAVPGTKPGSAKPQAVASAPPVAELTPLQAADKLLAMVGPTTKVTVPGTTTVAGRAAYQLVIAPRSSSSLIGQIVIAVDAKTYLPLQLQVFARGSSSPAFQIGFTSLTIGQPSMSNFTFTPPPGAKVKTVRLPSTLPGFAGLGLPFGPGMAVHGSSGAIVMPASPAGLPVRIAKLRQHLIRLGLRSMPGSPAALRKALRALRSGQPPAGAYSSRLVIRVPAISGAAAGPRVLGSGWLSVLAIPAGPALTAVVTGGGSHAQASASGSGPRGLAESATANRAIAVLGAGPPGPLMALLHTLYNAAAKVHGSWGSGRLLQTSLFSVLITSKGEVLIGAVTPAVLYADAAKVK
ncbi:MAG TPA: hypothetical protein VN840_06505 [Streptosporangiaceae bacterium]|nr:hypothetical protein [Streptosporangiaceae bacterium]